jgi:hypothetical protein
VLGGVLRVVANSDNEDPASLRELARKVKVIASGLQGSERSRLQRYAKELEKRATELEQAKRED